VLGRAAAGGVADEDQCFCLKSQWRRMPATLDGAFSAPLACIGSFEANSWSLRSGFEPDGMGSPVRHPHQHRGHCAANLYPPRWFPAFVT